MKREMKKIIKNQAGIAHASLVLLLISSLIVGSAGYAYNRVSNAAQKKSTSAKKTLLNVGTYNVRSQRWDKQNSRVQGKEPWSTRKPRVETVIKSGNPGIIGFQEVIAINPDSNNQVSQRGDLLSFMASNNYDCFAGALDNSSPICWKKDNFVLSSISGRSATNDIKIFDAGNSQRADAPASRYLTIVRLRQIHDNKQVVVFNYHFNQWENVDSQLNSLSNNISSVVNALPKGDRLIFTGDFNKKHNNVKNKLRSKGVNVRIASTYGGVDKVLVSSNVSIRARSSVIPGKPRASDHPLVVAKLTI